MVRAELPCNPKTLDGTVVQAWGKQNDFWLFAAGDRQNFVRCGFGLDDQKAVVTRQRVRKQLSIHASLVRKQDSDRRLLGGQNGFLHWVSALGISSGKVSVA